jgi:hypothetical protein
VGIGTSSPTQKLDVVGYGKFTSSDGSPRIYLTGSGVNYFLTNTSTGLFGVYDNTNSAYRLVIDSSGNVGIGTSSPSNTLDLRKDTPAFSQTSSSGAYYTTLGTNVDYTKSFVLNNKGSEIITYGDDTGYGLNLNGGASNLIRFTTNATEAMRIDSSGNVGIGNSLPLGRLTISNAAGTNAPSTVTAANTYLQLGSDDYGPSNNGKFMIGFGFTDATNTNSPAYIGYEEATTSGDTYGDLTFYTRSVTTDTAPTERMRIDSSGKVGIGVSPTGSLHTTVKDSGGSDVFVVAQNTTSNRIAGFKVLDESGTASLVMQYDNGGNVASISNPNNGSLGIYLGGSVAANLLNDYETGVFTPALSFGGASVGITYSNQYGRYTKVGRQVTVQVGVYLTSKGTSTGGAVVSGLPFNVTTQAGGFGSYAGTFKGAGMASLSNATNVIADENTTTLLLEENNASGASALTNANFTDATYFMATITYFN